MPPDLPPHQTAPDPLPGLAVVTTPAAAAAGLTPVWAAEPARTAGGLLLVGAASELVLGSRRRTAAPQRNAWAGAAITLLLALLILSEPWLARTALVLFVAIPFVLEGFDRSALGILSPLVAVIGDVVFALALAYIVIVRLRPISRRTPVEWIIR